jgi:predicted nucleic acid-binding protein
MVIADASAVVEMLLATPRGGAIAEHLFESGHPIAAPHLLDLEVLHVIRRFNRTDRLTAARAEQMLGDLGRLAITRYGHEPLRPAVWRLRSVLSAYDAAYVALAELLGGSIVTCDARLARSTGHDVTFWLF